MPYRLRPGWNVREDEIADALELRQIARGEGATAGIPFRQVLKLDAEKCGLEFTKAGIQPNIIVLVADF